MKASLCPTRSASHFRVPAASIHHVLLFTFVSVTTLSHLVFLLCFFLPVSLSSPPRPPVPLRPFQRSWPPRAGPAAVTDPSRSRVLSWILKRQTSAGTERDGNTMQLCAALADHRRHTPRRNGDHAPSGSPPRRPNAGGERRGGRAQKCTRAGREML